MSETKTIEAIVSGRVQMVMYRDFVRRKAHGLELIGTVGNKKDGTVRVLAQGSEENLKNFIEVLHKGPFLAHVSRVDVVWREPLSNIVGFKLLYE